MVDEEGRGAEVEGGMSFSGGRLGDGDGEGINTCVKRPLHAGFKTRYR